MLLILTLLVSVSLAHASVLDVPGGHGDLQAAVDAAAEGDTIRLAPGVYEGRLVLPDRTLTLASDDLFQPDSSAIRATVLDARNQGTLLSAAARQGRRLVLHGLTLRGGRGGLQDGHLRGGAVHLKDGANLLVRRCRFESNHSPVEGAVLGNDWLDRPGRIELEQVELCVGTAGLAPAAAQIRLFYAEHFQVRGMQVRSTGQESDLFSVIAGRVELEDLRVDSLASPYVQASLQGEHSLSAARCRFRGCSVADVALLSLGADSVHVEELELAGCRGELPSSEEASGQILLEVGGETLSMTGLTLRDNRLDFGLLGYLHASQAGQVARFHIEGNECGEQPPAGLSSGRDFGGRILRVEGCSLEDGVLRGNTSHLFPRLVDGQPVEPAAGDGMLLWLVADLRPDGSPAVVRRVRFEDNLVLDHDVEDPSSPYRRPNRGRALFVEVPRHPPGVELVMEQCLFRGNRQPTIGPERLVDPFAQNGRQVGSTCEVACQDGEGLWRGRVHLDGILLEDNDDGGLVVWNPAQLDAQEIVARRNARLGVVLVADSLELSNSEVSGTTAQEAWMLPPYHEFTPTWQVALGLWENGTGGHVRNISLVGNQTEVLLWGPRRSGAPLEIQGALVAGDGCRNLSHPGSRPGEYLPPRFHHSMVPQGLDVSGEGNLAGVDPVFDSRLGAPWQAPESPAVDEGPPDPQWNDVEDPLRPGFARWPALGGLRNDIGCTGGPRPMALDTQWVSLPAWQPGSRPRGLCLDAPWPNPFNPQTRVVFNLERPERIQLRVHNLLGQEVALLARGLHPAGRHEVVWRSAGLASGRYYVLLEGEEGRQVRGVTLLR